jgi:transcription elongation factor GreA
MQHRTHRAVLLDRGRVPFTPGALRDLQERAERLAAALAPVRVAAQARELDSNQEAAVISPDPELQLALSRLRSMQDALSLAAVVECADAVVVGSRVTTRHEEDGEESYVLVAPGDGDPRAGRVSCDSPLGRALLLHRAGDVVDVTSPIGVRRLSVLSVCDNWSAHAADGEVGS